MDASDNRTSAPDDNSEAVATSPEQIEEPVPIIESAAVTRCRNRILSLSDSIINDAISYMIKLIVLQTAYRMKELLENNNPPPAWLTETRVQEQIRIYTSSPDFKESVLSHIELVRREKDDFVQIYDELCKLYTDLVNREIHCQSINRSIEHVTEVLREVNIKVLQVTTVMELVLAASSRTNQEIDRSIHLHFGGPAPTTTD